MTLPQELKDAISQLPSAEKDKLIFRLLKKDWDLTNRLIFELVSDTTVEQQRAELKAFLDDFAERASKHFYSPGYLLEDFRSMSGEITRHVKMTKDKYGEISLTLYALNKILERNNEKIMGFLPQKVETFASAVISRTFKLLVLVKKMNEDYFMEFQNDLKELGAFINQNIHLKKMAVYDGLDVSWLTEGNIPNDIEERHKKMRESRSWR